MKRIDRLRAYQQMEAARPDRADTWKNDLQAIVWVFEIAEQGLGVGDHPDNWRHARYCEDRNPGGFGCECGLSKLRSLVTGDAPLRAIPIPGSGA